MVYDMKSNTDPHSHNSFDDLYLFQSNMPEALFVSIAELEHGVLERFSQSPSQSRSQTPSDPYEEKVFMMDKTFGSFSSTNKSNLVLEEFVGTDKYSFYSLLK